MAIIKNQTTKKMQPKGKSKVVGLKPIMERVVDFKSTCKELKIKPALPIVAHLPKKHQQSIVAFYMLTIMIEALNEGWVPNYNDSNEWKYYNYFWVKATKNNPSGVGFSNSHYDHALTNASVGARLLLQDSEKCEHMRKIATPLYKDYLLLPASKKVSHKIASL